MEEIMNKKEIIKKTELFVKETLKKESTGHDWWHSHHVRLLAKQIAKEEGADTFIVELASLLHDIGDYKFHQGNEYIGANLVSEWLSKLDIPNDVTNRIIDIISNSSFMKTLPDSKEKPKKVLTKEAMIVSDADNLDAMGAIGIARTFAFGGFFKEPIYDPSIKPRQNLTKEEYKKKNSTSINHFYEKLLKLKDKMYTTCGKKTAEKRHNYMKSYLKQFFDEWNCMNNFS